MKDITLLNQEAYALVTKKIESHSSLNNSLEKVPFLPLDRLNSAEEINDSKEIMSKVISTGAFTSGPYITEVESTLKDFYQAECCVATSSGTDALMIALKSVGIGYGDEVILPLNSFAATENAVMAIGATPIFANIDQSFNLIPSEIERLKTHKTKAVLPVCLYGSVQNIRESYQIAKKLDISVVLDAAQCFGIQDLINYCDVIALSFNPFKNIGTFGKSGALLTKSEEIGIASRQYSYHGFAEGKKNEKAQDWGFNSRIDNMQAAILSVKLKHFEENAKRRGLLASRYIKKTNALLKDITLPEQSNENTWHLFPLLLNEFRRDDLINFAKNKGVELDVFYPFLSHQGNHDLAKNYPNKEQFLSSENIHMRLLHLPLHNHMSFEEQDRVIEVIHEFFS